MTPGQRTSYLSMAARRARPGSGSGPLEVREGAAGLAAPDVRSLLGAVPFAIAGGLATRLYMPARMTLDVDVLVAAADRPQAERALAASGCTRRGKLTIGGSTWTAPDGTTLDLLALDAPWAAEAVASAVMAPDGNPYVRLPFLVLMKLVASRVQDLADISRMLALADADGLARTRALVAGHRPDDAEDLESLIRLGRLEAGQTGKGTT